MEDDKNIVVSNGIPLTFILFIVFLILKLTGTVTWSWWIITLPLWIGPALALGIIGCVIGVAFIVGIFVLLGYLGLLIYDKFTE